MLNNKTKMNLEKLKGRFDLNINPDLPIQTKIHKFLNEPIAFYLHKSRLFLQKIETKDVKPLSTREILDKIKEEQQHMDRKNRRAMIWANSRKLLEDWEDSSDFDEYGNKKKVASIKSPLSPKYKLT